MLFSLCIFPIKMSSRSAKISFGEWKYCHDSQAFFGVRRYADMKYFWHFVDHWWIFCALATIIIFVQSNSRCGFAFQCVCFFLCFLQTADTTPRNTWHKQTPFLRTKERYFLSVTISIHLPPFKLVPPICFSAISISLAWNEHGLSLMFQFRWWWRSANELQLHFMDVVV